MDVCQLSFCELFALNAASCDCKVACEMATLGGGAAGADAAGADAAAALVSVAGGGAAEAGAADEWPKMAFLMLSKMLMFRILFWFVVATAGAILPHGSTIIKLPQRPGAAMSKERELFDLSWRRVGCADGHRAATSPKDLGRPVIRTVTVT
jgi:hypothetical protein